MRWCQGQKKTRGAGPSSLDVVFPLAVSSLRVLPRDEEIPAAETRACSTRLHSCGRRQSAGSLVHQPDSELARQNSVLCSRLLCGSDLLVSPTPTSLFARFCQSENPLLGQGLIHCTLRWSPTTAATAEGESLQAIGQRSALPLVAAQSPTINTNSWRNGGLSHSTGQAVCSLLGKDRCQWADGPQHLEPGADLPACMNLSA